MFGGRFLQYVFCLCVVWFCLTAVGVMCGVVSTCVLEVTRTCFFQGHSCCFPCGATTCKFHGKDQGGITRAPREHFDA